MSIPAGTRFNSYEILCPIGGGGMGVVYRARDIRLGRVVAIKTLPAKCSLDPSWPHHFEQEARALSSINHPNIITLFALGDAAGNYYLVMEFVEGQTLRQRIATEKMRIRAVLDVGTQVASALGAAHSAGIVHRDIKPENVMIRPDGLVKVLDFGLAKLVSRSASLPVRQGNSNILNQDTLAIDDAYASESAAYVTIPHATPRGTNRRTILGTASYMSPEYVRGEEVDARTDIFSLGVTLYELISGVAPFGGQTPAEVIDAILAHEPVPLSHYQPGIPRELENVISKALRKDRDCRYQDIKDLLIDLQDLQQERQFEAILKRSPQYEMVNQARATITGRQSAGEITQHGLVRHKLSVVSKTPATSFVITGDGSRASVSPAAPVEINLVIQVSCPLADVRTDQFD